MCFFGKTPVGRRTLLTSLLLLPLLFIAAMMSGTQNTQFFSYVVTGNGRGEMGGYFGWVKNPEVDEKYWYSRHLYTRVLPSADIHNIALLANSSGYETLLVTEPLEYCAFPSRVAVKHRVVLYPNNVPIGFNIIVLESGYLTVAVNSDYFLRDDWMRTVFRKMFQDIHLPPDTISRFKLAVNHLVRAA
jgi:hypothetical protein